mmetsp:Transcript_72374/g.233945  ORF Transcript_72374/g.233945 Transcript_72374/m.233945 type:complete len:353 (-) Transcript_72374:14-1072(-)
MVGECSQPSARHRKVSTGVAVAAVTVLSLHWKSSCLVGPQAASTQPSLRGEHRFHDERRRGVYKSIDGKGWPSWDAVEGTSARTPRIGSVAHAWQGGSTFLEVSQFLISEAERGVLRQDRREPGTELVYERVFDGGWAACIGKVPFLGGLLSASSWSCKFLINQDREVDELSRLVSAPAGWALEHSSAIFLGHIVSVGVGSRATIAKEGSILRTLHRDWRGTHMVDSVLNGCVGRKRVILFAPDEIAPREGAPWAPNFDSERLRGLHELKEEGEAWRGLEALAKRHDVSGGVIDLGPGEFLFMPHGWWHALRPLDDLTVLTGPSKLGPAYDADMLYPSILGCPSILGYHSEA